MDLSHATLELFAALSAAQGEIEDASKNKKNPHFRSDYADLSSILETIRPIFSKHGLVLVQSTEFDGALVSVTTVTAHKSGGYITSQASCVPAKTDAQGVGSATTYLRRYSAAAMAGITQADDDGEASSHNSKPAKPKLVRKNLTDKDFERLRTSVESGNYDSYAAVLAHLEKVKVEITDEQKEIIATLFTEAA